LSILYYARDGLFCYSHDHLNMTHVGETLKAMRWRPPAEFDMPPRNPDRPTAMPKAWAGLPSAFDHTRKKSRSHEAPPHQGEPERQ
jgi:hypothetical protein